MFEGAPSSSGVGAPQSSAYPGAAPPSPWAPAAKAFASIARDLGRDLEALLMGCSDPGLTAAVQKEAAVIRQYVQVGNPSTTVSCLSLREEATGEEEARTQFDISAPPSHSPETAIFLRHKNPSLIFLSTGARSLPRCCCLRLARARMHDGRPVLLAGSGVE